MQILDLLINCRMQSDIRYRATIRFILYRGLMVGVTESICAVKIASHLPLPPPQNEGAAFRPHFFFNLTFWNKISSRFLTHGLRVCRRRSQEYSHYLSDHLPKDVRNFAAEGGHSLLWPEATTFLNHRVAYPRPEAATVACGRRTQRFMSLLSRLNPRQMATLLLLKHNCFRK